MIDKINENIINCYFKIILQEQAVKNYIFRKQNNYKRTSQTD